MNVLTITVFASLFASAFTPPSIDNVTARVSPPPATLTADAWARRLVYVTQPFIGAPYVLSPLGEGAGAAPDEDPRFRVDAFDCTTFVESAFALALGDDFADAMKILDSIRYRGGHVAYAQRRHFPESEWIPELVKAGLLVDVTREVGGDDVVVETKYLDARLWRRTRHPGLPELADERIPKGTFALDVWPLEKAMAASSRIPVGTVLHLVRIDYKNVPVRVSHQGIVLEVKGKRVLRHAADRMHHRVLDEPLDGFFRRMSKYKRWPVSGVHLTRFVPAADWRLRLQLETSAPLLPTSSSSSSSSSSTSSTQDDSIPVVPRSD